MQQRDLTLIELLTALAVTPLFAIVFGGLLPGQSRGYKDINDRSQLQSKLVLLQVNLRNKGGLWLN